MRQLREHVVYLTAAAGGIGSAVALALVKAGAHVALFDLDKDRLISLAWQLRALPDAGQIVPIVADLSTEAGVQAAVAEALTSFAGRADTLISLMGGLVQKPFATLSTQDWERALTLNLFSHIWTVKAVLPCMQRQGHGHILLMGSDQGRQPDAGLGAYAAAKAAVHALVKVLARELPVHGITCNGIAPGMTRTPLVLEDLMVDYAGEFETDVEEATRREIARRGIPLARLAEPEEVADAILFLIQNPFTNGLVMDLSGGNVRAA